MCESLCVREWVANEGILSLAYLKWHWSVQKTFICLYWRKNHTKSPARENMRDWKRRTKDVSQSRVRLRGTQLGVRLRSRELES